MIREINLTTGQIVEREQTADEKAEIVAAFTLAAWEDLRSTRNQLLAQSDWTVTTDSPMDVPAWIVYRQALRDLPANTTDPTAPVWPTPPA